MHAVSPGNPKFTLVGATTRVGLLSAPMRSRFTLQTRLDYYGREDLTKIVLRSCKLLDCEIDQKGAEEIAARARGTPRIANNLFILPVIMQSNGQMVKSTKRLLPMPWNFWKLMTADLMKWISGFF